MHFITIGSVIAHARINQNKIPRKDLIRGICTEQTLYALEENQYKTDTLMIDILLQRLGISPDKLEIVLSQEAYQLVRLRDLIEKAILRGRKELALSALAAHPAQNSVSQMYHKRMQACLSYRIDKDYELAAALLGQAVELTMPGFSYEVMEHYLISTIEMENLLALERVESESDAHTDLSLHIEHLEQCMRYIDRHFTDGEEHAKICAKCAWLLAKAYLSQNQTTQAMVTCEKGINALRQNTMIYFMLPLLELMLEVGNRLGIAPEQNKYVKYDETLRFLWDSYAQKWYPTDMLFHNCCQKEYHLDYELVKSERIAQHLQQEELIEGIYKNASSLSNFENAKVSPNKKTFEKMMEKLDLEIGRYNGFVATDSFETMELRHHLEALLIHGEYEKAEYLLENLKSQLDMSFTGNQHFVEDSEILIHRMLHKITIEEAYKRQKKLYESLLDADKKNLRHIPMRNEVLLINRYCIILLELGQKSDAINIYVQTIEKMQRSRMNVQYRYRSYSLLLYNYIHLTLDYSTACEILRNELYCGKASILPFGIHIISSILENRGEPKEIWLWYSECVYYMSDLYNFLQQKEKFSSFLKDKEIKIL
jgi:transcriptional regulator with XRE-family HTH domain